jgi:phosphoserine phosphatase
MPAVACLIADPAASPLDPALLREAERAVGGRASWLAEAEAAEVVADALDPAPVARVLAPLLEGVPADWAVLPTSFRRKRLLLCDMDGTIITVECVDELADLAGVKTHVAEITQRAMDGELDFAAALRERVALLAGLPRQAIEGVIRERLRLTPGARTLVGTMRAHGALTALVSGGFTAFTRHVRELCGFDREEANELEVEGDRLTGRLVGAVLGAEAKLAALERLRAGTGVGAEETLAVGDGANDLPMLGAAALGVAFRAHPRVRALAPVRVDHGDLTALLFLQGYRRSEFAGP